MVLLVTTLIALAMNSYAQADPAARDPGVNARQRAQHARIAEGVKSGELTRPEAARLRHE